VPQRTHRVRVPLPSSLVPVTIVRRRNRFAVDVRAGRRRLALHLPNSGRMQELLVTGAVGLAAVAAQARGRTQGTLVLVRHRGRWVGVDARLPNRLFEAALRAGALRPFRGYRRWRREVPVAGVRLDFVLEGPGGPCLVETKSCNRVDDGVALFPDAPTVRGTAHLRLLARAARAGRRAAVVWFVQRDDARVLRPFAAADPDFALAMARAAQAGVEFYAYTCRVTPRAVTVGSRIPVQADPKTVAARRVRPRRWVRAYIGLGSNQGDRLALLQDAEARLAAQPQIRITGRSPVYESEPVGYTAQPWFLNRVLQIETTLPPHRLLTALQAVEAALGRVRTVRWGPRTIDLDLLLYGEATIATPRLVVPHPELPSRRFVLQPLVDLDPNLRLPDGRSVRALLQAVGRAQALRMVAG